MGRILLCLLVAFGLTPEVVLGQEKPPTREQIEQWVRDLGARRFTARQKALEQLRKAGRLAEPALEEALKHSDGEIRKRAAEILDEFKWGIYPDTPKKIVDLVKSYQAAASGGKDEAIQKLLNEGGPGVTCLIKIVRAETNEENRRNLVSTITREAGRAIPLLILHQERALLGKLLEMVLEQDSEVGLPNYAAFHLLAGSLDERIKQHRKQAEAEKEPGLQHQVLFYLHRARGDVSEAVALADKLKRDDWAEAVLEENARWKELLKRSELGKYRPGLERPAFRAAYARLAGDARAFEAALAEARKMTEGKDDSDRLALARMLFMHRRPAEARKLLTGPWMKEVKYDILVAASEFDEALKIVEAEETDPPLVIRRASTLYQIGEKEKAGKLFSALGEKLKQDNSLSWYEQLLEAEYNLGLKAQADAHAARLLEAVKDPTVPRNILKKCFPGRADTALMWWTYFREHRKQGNPMKAVRDLLEGRITGKELASLLEAAEAASKSLDPDQVGWWLHSIAEGAAAAGDRQRAILYFRKASDVFPESWARLGDVLAEEGKYEDAAAAYARAWEADRQQPLHQFLQGWCLVKAGKKKEGEARLEAAVWFPLGNDALAVAFSEQLMKRGHHDAARRVRATALRVHVPGSFLASDLRRHEALDARRRGDWLDLADNLEWAMLHCLRENVAFVHSGAYLSIPYLIHASRARGLLLANRWDQAKTEVQWCLETLPASIGLPLDLVRDLEKKGKKKEAEELFTRVLEANRKLVKQYPRSAHLHNTLAWLCAACRRNLAEGRKSAEKAVELVPETPAYRDTLAEILFQQGEKNRAVALMKQCVAQEPGRKYYRLQLKRMEAGDPRAELPPEDQ